MKLRSVFTPLARFGRKVGEFNSRVLLSVVYIIGLGSAAVLAKILRKHFLDLKVEPEKESYWAEQWFKSFHIRVVLRSVPRVNLKNGAETSSIT